MTVFVFGNPDISFDSTPLAILPELARRFPNIAFVSKDPNEEFDISEHLIIIDTVAGIDRVSLFSDLKNFSGHPHVSLHDFDLWSNLSYLQKLGKLKKITIIGIPPVIAKEDALEEASAMLRSIAP